MQQKKSLTTALILVFCVMLFLSTGCAVLTSSQVKEVEKFAKVSKGYSELPGELGKSYGILLRNSKLLSITREEIGRPDSHGKVNTAVANVAWQTIQNAYKDETTFTVFGKQMDEALSVLQIYSDLLITLVDNDFTDALSDKAEKFGKSLDDATEAYNAKYSKDNPLKLVGGTIAMAVRAAGGLYIRQQQAAILRSTLYDANPLVIGLMDDVKFIASEKFRPALVNYETNYIGNVFKSVLNNRTQIDITTVVFTYDNLFKTRQCILLCEKIAKSAETYKMAHDDLVKNTRNKKTMTQFIETIEALSKEVSAANEIRSKVSK